MNIKKFFSNPKIPRQKQYEALRSIAVDKLPVERAATRFGYTAGTLYSLLRDFKSGKIVFFPEVSGGPKIRHTPEHIQKLIAEYRKDNVSASDIKIRLQEEGYKTSVRTVERILTDRGYPRLHRRTSFTLGRTQKNQSIPEIARPLNFEKLKPFRYDCPVAGVFFFLPYIIESEILQVVKQCQLPESTALLGEQACLSMLLLKLIGSERLSHIAAYDHEPGLGVFTGLNYLPKATFMTTYSCRTSNSLLLDFQKKLMERFQEIYPEFYESPFINLDFHSIPHFGEQSKMEKVWCGARGKAIKGANTLFAQDSHSNAILYTRADILRKNEANEIKNFVTYWKEVRKKNVCETLVFDCKLTTYRILDELSADGVQFITLRKRNKELIAATEKIPDKDWKKIYLNIPKRKYKSCSIYVTEVTLPKCKNPVKQITITDQGRAQPTYVITNNRELSLEDILEVYAKRWHIENKFAELVSFFNLNALSSPLMIRIHFDILWTIIADTLYHRLAQDLPRFEREQADTLFRNFINMPGQVIYDGEGFTIKIRKRAHTPILMGVKRLQQKTLVPWLGNRPVKIEWTA